MDEEDGRLRAALYVKDGLAEEWAFSSVRDDVPGLRDQAAWDALERVVRHAADVEPVLRRALKEAGLEFVGIRFLNGQGGAGRQSSTAISSAVFPKRWTL